MSRVSIFSFLYFISSLASAQTFVANEWVVRIKPKQFHAQIKKTRAIDTQTFVATAQTREELLKISGVEKVEPNYIYKMTGAPNDPLFASQWSLQNSGQADSSGISGVANVDIDIVPAWNLTTGSKKVVVAVIDSGVDFTIPDLKNNAWTNLAELNGMTGVDDDKNGYIDDIHGFNFVSNSGDSTDDNGHGSHCAGTIGGQGNDKNGIAGINWQSSIMALKFISNDGTGTLENAVKAIGYARKNGAKVISSSWGGNAPSEILQDAVNEATQAGIVFVAAAGNDALDNDKTPFYPASYANVIGVASINNRARPSSFSNFGASTVQIAAPGENILSTTPKGFESMSGTSMAAPQVAGVAALLLSREPTLTAVQVNDRIVKNARPLFRLKNRVGSGGILDAFAALTNTRPGPDLTDPQSLRSREVGSVSTPHPYANLSDQVYKIQISGAKRIALHFAKFQTEANFDFVEILDPSGRSYDKLSGVHDDELTDIIEGDTILLHFTSDKSNNAYGFDVDEVFYE